MDATQHEPLALVINAGGPSRRMGRQKALLPMPPHGLPLIVHVIRRLKPLAGQWVFVVANDPAIVAAVSAHFDAEVKCVPDRWLGAGPLSGIATGLALCPGWAMIAGCDMPLLNVHVFAHLAQRAVETDNTGARKWDIVVPRVHDRTQTMHALYHHDVLPVAEELLRAGDLSVLRLFPKVRTLFVQEAGVAAIDPELLSFRNVNTPEEWAAIQPLLLRTFG